MQAVKSNLNEYKVKRKQTHWNVYFIGRQPFIQETNEINKAPKEISKPNAAKISGTQENYVTWKVMIKDSYLILSIFHFS